MDQSNVDFSQFKTGDLCISRTLGKFASLIRGITISNYNHVCIAIRIEPKYLPRLKIVREGGVILFLEKVTYKKTGEVGRTLRINLMENVKVLRLPLKDELYTPEFEQKITQLLYQTAHTVELKQKEYIEIRREPIQKLKSYSRSLPLPYIENACSENTADFYFNTLYKHIDKNIIPASVFVPQTFLVSEGNPYYNLFESVQIIYDSNPNDNYWLELIVSIIIIILILCIMYFFLRYLYRKIKYT